MNRNIKIINPGNMAGNCYLITTPIGFILIITGEKTNFTKLDEHLTEFGCTSDNLQLIVLTYRKSFRNKQVVKFREKYHSKIAMHIIDEVFIDAHDSISYKIISFFRKIIAQIKKEKEFEPDFTIDEGSSLSRYGLNARIINLSHITKGSIGILTDEGELFCDDLFENNTSKIHEEITESFYIDKFKRFMIDIVYPGHGDPLSLQSHHTQ